MKHKKYHLNKTINSFMNSNSQNKQLDYKFNKYINTFQTNESQISQFLPNVMRLNSQRKQRMKDKISMRKNNENSKSIKRINFDKIHNRENKENKEILQQKKLTKFAINSQVLKEKSIIKKQTDFHKQNNYKNNRLLMQSQKNMRKIQILKAKNSVKQLNHKKISLILNNLFSQRVQRQKILKAQLNNYQYATKCKNFRLKTEYPIQKNRLSIQNIFTQNLIDLQNSQISDKQNPHKLANVVRIIEQYNQGSTSTVYRGVLINRSIGSTYQQIIVKKVQINNQHINRESIFVKQLNNPYIVKFRGIYQSQEYHQQKNKRYLNIIMEKYDFNLRQVLSTEKINNLTIKLYLYQMLRSLVYLHAHSICHRDLKPQNFLVKGWRIVLSDFGMSKTIKHDNNNKKGLLLYNSKQDQNQQSMTYVFARQYRAPQLLFNYNFYDKSVDIWALGCIAMQMMTQKVLFQGTNNLDQLTKIFKIFGTPKWQKISFMNKRIPNIPKIKGIGLSQILHQKILKEQKHFLGLIQKMLQFDPQNRITALDALTLPYFDEIRQQTTYRSIFKLLSYPSLFHFSKREIFGRQELLVKLVPFWIKQHCKKFGIEILDIKKL